MTKLTHLLLLLIAIIPFHASAESDRSDFDVDDDGLIEIYDLEDLDAINWHLDGRALYEKDIGCPLAGCAGFELANDLNFDTNGDGIVDDLDEYSSGGVSWHGIGTLNTNNSSEEPEPFTAIFEGNGFNIKNMPLKGNNSLFLITRGAVIRNVNLLGVVSQELTYNFGALASRIEDTTVVGCSALVAINNDFYAAAGLIGTASHSIISASYTHLQHKGANQVYPIAGIVGELRDESTLEYSYSIIQSNINRGSSTGRHSLLVQVLKDDSAVVNSYAVHLQGDSGEELDSNLRRYAEFQCASPTADHDCNAQNNLYQQWDAVVDGSGQAYWNFGTEEELPYLNHQPWATRDDDGDSVINQQDQFPQDYQVALDLDGDGFADRWNELCFEDCQNAAGLKIDQFPSLQSVALDGDADGLADAWTPVCGEECQNNSGINLDNYLSDSDNDGIPNAIDNDDNGDGEPDADLDSNGLVEIRSLEDLNAIRNVLNSDDLHPQKNWYFEASGCPVLQAGDQNINRCRGFELVADLNFDTNEDGVLNELDDYWNQGEGWNPIGNYQTPFMGELNGNGYAIKNLFVYSKENLSGKNPGLFSHLKNAKIQDLAIYGPKTLIKGQTALVMGYGQNTVLERIYFSGTLEGELGYQLIGGNDNIIDSVLVLGDFKLPVDIVLSEFSGAKKVVNSLFIPRNSEGVISGKLGVEPENSYWVNSFVVPQQGLRVDAGISIKEIVCSNNVESESCRREQLFDGWDNSAWDLGQNDQLPGLRLAGRLYRDSDADGVLDENDDFPLIYAASEDSDTDGAPDFWTMGCDDLCVSESGLILDHFPEDSNIAADEDLDTLPDYPTSLCNSDCQQAYAFDPSTNDYDNDGLADDVDHDDNNDGIEDIDADSDGLVDVRNIQQFDAIRYSLRGHGLKMTEEISEDSSGCPPRIIDGAIQRKCRGYEFMNDLQFDTNLNGRFDEQDEIWNDGKGWSVIGKTRQMPFQAELNGNGYRLLNWHTKEGALFGFIANAKIIDLHMQGGLTQIVGSDKSAGFARFAFASTIQRSSFAGSVYTSSDISWSRVQHAAGILGFSFNVKLEENYANAYIEAGGTAGLVAETNYTTVLANYTAGAIKTRHNSGQLSTLISNARSTEVLYSYSSVKIEHGASRHYEEDSFVVGDAEDVNVIASYWAYDHASNIQGLGAAVSIDELLCADSPNNQSCAEITLYEGWEDIINQDGDPRWIFPEGKFPPILHYQILEELDSDSDLVADINDAFPRDRRVAIDVDNDGFPDAWTEFCDHQCQIESNIHIDQFPLYPEAAVDFDLDGLPDSWNSGCVGDCISQSELSVDLYTGDTDNDGIPNEEDTDDDGDGVEDADADGDGLIDISKYSELVAMLYSLDGRGQRLSENDPVDTTGCPIIYSENKFQARCQGYELMSDIVLFPKTENVGQARNWVPLGTAENVAFTGIFEGNFHTIRGLGTEAIYDKSAVGFFRYATDAVIQNVGFDEAFIGGEGNVGGVVGVGENIELNNVFFNGRVTGTKDNVGGLVGKVKNSLIQESFFMGEVIGANAVGGLAGQSESTDIFAAYFEGEVSGAEGVGGLLGWLRSDEPDQTAYADISASYAITTITGTLQGGMIGRGGFAKINSSYAVIESNQNNLQLSNQSTRGDIEHSYFVNEMDEFEPVSQAPTYSSIPKLWLKDAKGLDTLGLIFSLNVWSSYSNIYGEPYWVHGSVDDYPFLNTAWGNYLDYDADGVLDRHDRFPRNSAVAVDSNNNSIPDYWNASCDDSCKSSVSFDVEDPEYMPVDDEPDQELRGAGAMGMYLYCLLMLAYCLGAKPMIVSKVMDRA